MCAKCHIVKQGLISHGNVLGGTYTSLKELFCLFFFFLLLLYYGTCSVLSDSENLSSNVIISIHCGCSGSLCTGVPFQEYGVLNEQLHGFGGERL